MLSQKYFKCRSEFLDVSLLQIKERSLYYFYFEYTKHLCKERFYNLGTHRAPRPHKCT